MILAIETSASICGAALVSESGIITEYFGDAPMQQASLLGQYVEKLIRETNLEIQLVAVAIGPGSFTGLRIGLSYAQGFCFGQGIPIIGVSNHQVLAAQAVISNQEIYSIIDAHRKELYLAYHANNKTYDIESHKIVEIERLQNETSENSIVLCRENLVLPQKVAENINLKRVEYKTSLIAKIGMDKYKKSGSDDIEKLEPMYIRPFAGFV